VKASEYRELSIEELEAKLFNVKIKKSTGQLENTAKLTVLRRDIARAETILFEKRGATK
jgi:large subunit ribosomal protein L29